MAENLTPKKYIDDSNMKQILAAIKDKTPVGGEYVTEEQLLAKDYATKIYVGEQIANAEHLKREIVTVLPSDKEASDNVIYMLKVESATGNDKYQEYMKIDGTVKMVGDTSVDLTDYAKSADIPTSLPANGGNANTVNNHTVKSDVPENAVFTDTIYDDTELKGSIEGLSSNLGEKVDYKVVVEDGNRYVEDIVVQDINTWLPNDNSSILINLKKTNGANYLNFQLLCNKQDSKNWSCIVNGAAHELWKIRYVNGVRYIDELATMDKVKDGYVRILKNNDTDTNEAMFIAYKAFDAFGLRISKGDDSEHELKFSASGISYVKDGVTIWTK